MKNIFNSVILAVLTLSGTSHVQSSEVLIDSAGLLQIVKEMDKQAYVHNTDFDIVYTIFNTGTKDVSDVQVTESSFAKALNLEQKFKEKKITFAKIAPGEKVSKTFTYLASELGTYRPTMSKVTYNNGITDVTGYTSKPRQFRILTSAEYDYELGTKVMEWTVYFLTTAMLILFPLAMYLGSSGRYKVPIAEASASTLTKKKSKGN